MTGIDYSKVDAALLDEVVRRIRAVADPVRIVLFGSWARGTPHEHSDLDLLIVEDGLDGPATERCATYRHALTGLNYVGDKDIVVATQGEIDEWAGASLAFLTTVTREGKVLYERQS